MTKQMHETHVECTKCGNQVEPKEFNSRIHLFEFAPDDLRWYCVECFWWGYGSTIKKVSNNRRYEVD